MASTAQWPFLTPPLGGAPVYASIPIFDLGDGEAAVGGGATGDEVTAPLETERAQSAES